MHPAKLDSVLRMSGEDRVGYFVRRVAGFECAWVLESGGAWAAAEDDLGRHALPVWPEEAFASACATDEWAGYRPLELSLARLLLNLNDEPDFERVAVFPTPQRKGVFVEPAVLAEALQAEAAQYE